MSKNKNKASQSVNFDKILGIIDSPESLIHFVGIGGVSMYSLARLTKERGARVSGSDRERNERTKALEELLVKISIGHSAENIHGASLVVYSHAIDDDNPELAEAKRLGIPTVNRAEYMGALMLGYRRRIGVSGSHGKSTTVAILDLIFTHAGLNPTVLSGADLSLGDSFKSGGLQVMIYEACEYKDSFLRFSPTISVGLNLELDHTDYFRSIEDMKLSFSRALGKATELSVICGDDPNLRQILSSVRSRVVTFGSREDNDYHYNIISFLDGGYEFSLSKNGAQIGIFRLNIPGVFNVHNAAAAIVTAIEYGLPINLIREAVADFRGIGRRLEYIGQLSGREIYYDYAHHPTEISASINALKVHTGKPLTVVFKPHTYSRTASLWEELKNALSLADCLILTDIYPAREDPISGVNSERLAGEIDGAVYCTDAEVCAVVKRQTEGTIVLMGAGDVEIIRKALLSEN